MPETTTPIGGKNFLGWNLTQNKTTICIAHFVRRLVSTSSTVVVVKGSCPLKFLGYNDFCATLMTKEPYKDDLKDVLFLVEILSASEQSRHNRIKNCNRASLQCFQGSGGIDQNFRTGSYTVSDFDPTSAVTQWFAPSQKPQGSFFQLWSRTDACGLTSWKRYL